MEELDTGDRDLLLQASNEVRDLVPCLLRRWSDADGNGKVRVSTLWSMRRAKGSRMKRLRTWIAQAALWQVWAYFFFAWTLLHFIISAGRSPAGAVGGGVFFASVMTAFTARRRRGDAEATGRETSLAEISDFDRAIESGRVPPDPSDRAALRGLTERRLRQARSYLWYGTVMWTAFLALSVWLMFETLSADTAWETAVFAFFLVWGTVFMRRQRARSEAVRRLLEVQGPSANGAETPTR